ncbi:CheR family methyltransferase, partial [Staphylococcus aureus]|uniref:CheR family methyltransferase n=1 Tax=Staphylococcus aureus TaxID=1280 RepID=UPI003211B134
MPETWFFRDQIPFDVLSSLAKSRLGSGDVIRIASMPCSTGEEPYSIAITMLEAGFEPGSFTV